MNRLKVSNAPPLDCLTGVIFSFLDLAFAFLGAIAVIFLLIGAVKYITSRGDPKAVKSARETMTYAIIGTVLVGFTFVMAQIISNFFVPGGFNIFDFHIN